MRARGRETDGGKVSVEAYILTQEEETPSLGERLKYSSTLKLVEDSDDQEESDYEYSGLDLLDGDDVISSTPTRASPAKPTEPVAGSAPAAANGKASAPLPEDVDDGQVYLSSPPLPPFFLSFYFLFSLLFFIFIFIFFFLNFILFSSVACFVFSLKLYSHSKDEALLYSVYQPKVDANIYCAHPANVVEAHTLASVELPDCIYTPSLPRMSCFPPCRPLSPLQVINNESFSSLFQ